MNSFRLFLFAKKNSFFALLSSFFPSVALLCNSKKPSKDQKMNNFRLKAKSLNEFYFRIGGKGSKNNELLIAFLWNREVIFLVLWILFRILLFFICLKIS